MSSQQVTLASDVKVCLVVENDEDVGEVIQLILSQETGYYSILVTDPEEALRVADQVKPDIFIIDYHLRKMNGFELYDRLHTSEGLQDVSAVIASTNKHRHEQELKERRLVGLGEPFDIDELLDSVKRAAV